MPFKGPRFTAWLTPVSSLCLNSESIEGKGQMHQSSKSCEGDDLRYKPSQAPADLNSSEFQLINEAYPRRAIPKAEKEQ